MVKKVVIIGGGVAGMTAAVYCLKNGFECDILEKTKAMGGNLTGWERDGYHIDNCIHWLTGTLKGTELYDIWTEIGALDGTEPKKLPYFYKSEQGTRSVALWRDVWRTRREMLEISPRDRKEIERFINAVIMASRGISSENKSALYKTAAKIGQLGLLRYGLMNLNTLASRFENRLLSSLMTDAIDGEFNALGLIYAYATFVVGNGDIPSGGSAKMARRISEKIKALGGNIYTDTEVEKIVFKNGKAVGVKTKTRGFFDADFIICATDPVITFGTLLDKDYMPSELKKAYKNPREYPVFSSVHAAFSCDSDSCSIKGSTAFDIEPLYSDGYNKHRLFVREFSHEPSFAPEGKVVLQSMVFQRERSCRGWLLAANDREKYENLKQKTGQQILKRIETAHPETEGKLELLDVWTPATYNEYFSSYCGAYMGFALREGQMPLKISNTIKGVKNVVLATGWQVQPGGLPIAARSGKQAAEIVIKRLKD